VAFAKLHSTFVQLLFARNYTSDLRSLFIFLLPFFDPPDVTQAGVSEVSSDKDQRSKNRYTSFWLYKNNLIILYYQPDKHLHTKTRHFTFVYDNGNR